MKAKLLRPFDETQGLSIYFSSQLKEKKIFLRYELISDDDPIMPLPVNNPAPADNLWQHTCFELFCKKVDTQSYLEFNFSPSGEWNCYHFENYREGMKKIELLEAPIIEYHHTHLNVELNIPENYVSYFDQLHPCAVIEFKNEKKYLACDHLKSVPDFHAF